MSYHKNKDLSILKSCLSEWFRNPKDLNLTSPQTKYPFSFNHWVNAHYQDDSIFTLVLSVENWIVGHISMKPYPDKKLGHIFHLFVAQSHRKQGYGLKLLSEAEELIKENGYLTARLNVLPKNTAALAMYQSTHYTQADETPTKSFVFLKTLCEDSC
ncbi:MAG: GNAT family N-acetyltransferase [Candidatus Marinimicrobia bacterium]|jgi:GNAT superfamily N-acetyltransferase|nr:GNAT family N-acetyltransferase [Candidatus Neomarinimicrobiota bacterium]MBT3496298.1 GNAT family N-acetyltransferase [Candidatus Neomarinimicrobiota bacterium]MBT3691978.1 GNAT family N-acetyltransferase [Candidatus Neomarinimicrobiota bacterium]MBT3732221.1 GNAT family N-acetyltransferase [Candidatus Neomarinimicrobiota bacterium]MBT4144532.1 GNAT family N-acetyltransferase [Candidatus Neomarinimicrobiota bacterium]